MNSYILIIAKSDGKNHKDVIVKANDIHSARRTCEICYLGKNETIMCIFPENRMVIVK